MFFKRLLNAIFPRKSVIARFNAASRSPDSMRNFQGSDFLSADAAMSRSVRQLIASRARNEFDNNSYANGIIMTLADDTIGRGPCLQLEHDGPPEPRHDEALTRRERRFHKWARDVKLNDLLRCARIAKAVDGETFIRLQTNPNAPREVKLEPRLYESEYVESSTLAETPLEYHASGEPMEIDGIFYDQYGNPIRYHFWRIHPGSPLGGAPFAYTTEDAKFVIHYGNFYRAGQHRGISEMAPALNIFNDLRRYSTAVVLAAEVAARLSFIVSNDLPAEMMEGTVEVDENGRISQTALDMRGPIALNSGEFNGLVLPAGYKTSQMKAEQPTQQYVSFKDAKIAEAARVFSMPFNVAAGNSSSYNYASGRLDHQVYHKKLLIERDEIASVILDRIFETWQAFDSAAHPADYVFPEEGHYWMWDGFEHVDPVKEASAQAMRLANGVTTLAEECAREGRDYQTILRQRAREIQDCQDKGLPPMPWMNVEQPVVLSDKEE